MRFRRLCGMSAAENLMLYYLIQFGTNRKTIGLLTRELSLRTRSRFFVRAYCVKFQYGSILLRVWGSRA